MDSVDKPEGNLVQNATKNAEQYLSAGPMTVYNLRPTGKFNYTQYLKLVEEYKKEIEEGKDDFVAFIKKIQHYTTSIDEEFIGLQKKLENGGFASDYSWALPFKQMYAKKLTEENLSTATQKIHAFILAKVCVTFNMHVKTAIDNGHSKEIIPSLINTYVITPLEDMLGEDNVLDLYSDDILGMVYYLTGNCHIKW